MKDNRRDFLKKGASLIAATSVGGVTSAIASPYIVKEKGHLGSGAANLAKDAGMQSSEAYFDGMKERKIALLKQMDVFGAVGGINTKMVAMDEAKPYDEKPVA